MMGKKVILVTGLWFDVEFLEYSFWGYVAFWVA